MIKPTSDSIFCNRELNFDSLDCIGFDMDYTIAEYLVPAFDLLAFNGAVDKLVDNLGYPESVRNFAYDSNSFVRGLLIDIKRGNFIKIDRHKYVRQAMHGLSEMSSSYRKVVYHNTFNKVDSFSNRDYVPMDTLFQLVDASIYAQLIDLKDGEEYEFLDGKTYEEMYRDVRGAVDLCHRDGVIKDEVARNPSKYIKKDPGMVEMLKRLRDDGKKVFLLTNSLWEYTQTVMSFLVEPSDTPSGDWADLFEVVIVGSAKPKFLVDPYQQLFRVNREDGSLQNTDGVFEIEAMNPNGAEKFLAKGKVFQGGNWQHLQAMLNIESGESVLYVGDHLYSDVLRSKRTLGWRTALIVPELEHEMRVYEDERAEGKAIEALRTLRKRNAENVDQLKYQNLQQGGGLEKEIEECEAKDEQVKKLLQPMADSYHKRYNPTWGQLFKAGYQDSRFSFYVNNYACIYTTRASNFKFVSGQRSIRTGIEKMPHERRMDDWASLQEGAD